MIKLADFLENHVLDEQFDLKHYRADNGIRCDFESVTKCGTVGCAVGWAPHVIPYISREYNGRDGVEFYNYANRVFGCVVADDNIGDYMFSSLWAEHPTGKTRTATIARIRAVVDVEGELTNDICAGLVEIKGDI